MHERAAGRRGGEHAAGDVVGGASISSSVGGAVWVEFPPLSELYVAVEMRHASGKRELMGCGLWPD